MLPGRTPDDRPIFAGAFPTGTPRRHGIADCGENQRLERRDGFRG